MSKQIIKTCNRCKEQKELTMFSKKDSSRDGYNSVCKNCKNVEDKKRAEQKKFDKQFEIF